MCQAKSLKSSSAKLPVDHQSSKEMLQWWLVRFFHARLLKSNVRVVDLALCVPLFALVATGIFYNFVEPGISNSGMVAYFAIVWTFVLSFKTTSVLQLIGVSWEQVVPYHKYAAMLSIVLSTFHLKVVFLYSGHEDKDSTSLAISKYSNHGPETNFFRYLFDDTVNMSGTVMIIAMFVLVGSSATRWLRARNFDLWLAVHISSSVSLIVFSLVHSASALKLIFAWWGVDVFLRCFVLPACFYPKSATITALSDNLVEIRCPKGSFRYQAGQFVKLCIPKAGVCQFHPVSISSAPFEDDLTFHFRVMGDWTKKVWELGCCTKDVYQIFLQGPFGRTSSIVWDDYKRHSSILLVCGGIGVTPCLSLARQLLHAHDFLGQPRRRIQIVWVTMDFGLSDTLPLAVCRRNKPARMSKDASEDRTEWMLNDIDDKSNVEDSPLDQVLHATIFCDGHNPELPAWVDSRFDFQVGRPNIEAFIARALQLSLTGSRVAVFACGPPGLVGATQAACQDHPAGQLDFHREVFAY